MGVSVILCEQNPVRSVQNQVFEIPPSTTVSQKSKLEKVNHMKIAIDSKQEQKHKQKIQSFEAVVSEEYGKQKNK